MRFWSGLILSLFGGLLGLGLFRELIKLNAPILDDPTLDIVSFVLRKCWLQQRTEVKNKLTLYFF